MSHSIKLGVVPTHCKFVGGLVPDEDGCLPRESDGELVVLAEMRRITGQSHADVTDVQISYFSHAKEADVDELFTGLKSLGLTVHLILMVGGVDPMSPADEDAFVDMLRTGLDAARKHGIRNVASTSLEEWMKDGAVRKEGADYEAAVAQLAKAHVRACREADVTGAGIESWHIEFLRGGEFQTFTDLGRAWDFVAAANREWGSSFFKVMVDAAHCGDSSLSLDENIELVQKIADSGELGIFHASSPTTRGCMTSDDGWIPALLAACARSGGLEYCMIEMFHHDDEALAPLRNLVAGHGIDTTDGRSYTECILEGLSDLDHRLNNLAARGALG